MSDNTSFVCCMTLAAFLAFAFGWAMAANEERDDQTERICMSLGRQYRSGECLAPDERDR